MFRRLLILLLWVIAIVAVAVVWVRRPVYRSTAAIRVAATTPPLVYAEEEPLPQWRAESDLQAQAFLLRTSPFLERVVHQPQVQESNWHQQPTGPVQTQVDRLRDALEVEIIPDTDIIKVSCDLPAADDAKLLVNTVVDEFLLFHSDTQKRTEGWLLEALNKERTTLEKEIDGLMATRYNIARRLGETGPDALLDRCRQSISQLRSEKRQLERKLELHKWDLRRLQGTDGKTSPPTPTTGPSSPTGQARQADLQRDMARTEYEISLVEDEIGDLQSTASDLGDMVVELAAYEEQIDQKKGLVERVRKRMQKLELESKNTLPRITIVEPGRLPAGAYNEARAAATAGIALGALVLTILLRLGAAKQRR